MSIPTQIHQNELHITELDEKVCMYIIIIVSDNNIYIMLICYSDDYKILA